MREDPWRFGPGNGRAAGGGEVGVCSRCKVNVCLYSVGGGSFDVPSH